jgi:hypothetical protein
VSQIALRLVALLAALSVMSCDAGSTERPAADAASRATAPSPSTFPRDDESQSVTDALTRTGARPGRVLASKFDWLFDSAAPRAGTFEVTIDGQSTWVDVHFLERSLGPIVACSGQPMTSLAGTFSVAVDGRLQSLQNASVTGTLSSGAMYFAASDRLFVMTPDLRLRDLLGRALALRVPSCRVPADLPVFPQEQSVLDALDRAGIQLTLIGGSKFETLLGDRLPARVFIEQAGVGGGGADVLFLDRPIPGIRVCVSRAASGLNRYEIFIGDRKVSDGEGTQAVLYSVSDRYFVQAIGTRFHEALMQGLGTVTPPC